jgi:hypothetical protein
MLIIYIIIVLGAFGQMRNEGASATEAVCVLFILLFVLPVLIIGCGLAIS